jgi:hypothetical protein
MDDTPMTSETIRTNQIWAFANEAANLSDEKLAEYLYESEREVAIGYGARQVDLNVEHVTWDDLLKVYQQETSSRQQPNPSKAGKA